VAALAGKIALVTGAGRGIGRAIALRLGAEGAVVAVHYNASAEAAQRVAATITHAGGTAFTLAADLADMPSARALIPSLQAELQRRFGVPQFDILVNNAGIGGGGAIETVTEAIFDRVMQVNLKAPFFLIQQALTLLRDHGRIINISSIGTRSAYPRMAAYSPAKAGLEALSLLLASHLGPRGITVNAVLPGATVTDMNAGARDPVTSREIAATVALRRVGQPEDIADIVAFLASDRGRWITGQCIDASGGQRI
jgi:3-oxoacyl-[acyl-carrier protein] reductase